MTTFRAAQEADRKAPRVVVLPPSAFASDWKDRPTDPNDPDAEVAIGVRFISATDIDVARAEAYRRAVAWMTDGGKTHDVSEYEACRNDQLLYLLVARAACDVNDIDQPWFPRPAEDTIRDCLTAEGARRIWDEMQILHAGSGVGMPVAGDGEVKKLAAILWEGSALAKASPAVQLEARKLVSYLLEQLGALAPEAVDDPEADDEDDDGYTAVAAPADDETSVVPTNG